MTPDIVEPPETKKKYILVLDMDETLVHYDITTKTFATRPFAKNFIRNMSKHWELVVFTAGLKDYADTILNELDPTGYITRRFYRDSCTYTEGVYIKDLKTVQKNVDLAKIVIVDNIPLNFSF
jgi:TFIIF-interacting CTD phosphatase-like protein